MSSNKKFGLLLTLFLGFLGFWMTLNLTSQTNDNYILDVFAGLYGVVALFGGLWGLHVAKGWGGLKSVIGKAVIMLSLGLLLQEFGQLSYAYYAVVKKTEIPYPSVGDVGYFGSVLLYIYAVLLINKASGYKYNIKKLSSKAVAFLLPAVLLLGSYMYFLRGYSFDWSHPLTVLLDFGYPLGQTVYIAFAILAFLLSRKLLGGIMRGRISLLIFALCAQYAADFNFLFQASHETWTTAGYGDFMYLVSYTIMAMAILYMDVKGLEPSKNMSESMESSAEVK